MHSCYYINTKVLILCFYNCDKYVMLMIQWVILKEVKCKIDMVKKVKEEEKENIRKKTPLFLRSRMGGNLAENWVRVGFESWSSVPTRFTMHRLEP